MDRALRVFTGGWVNSPAIALFTSGYYPVVLGPLAQGRVCLTAISMTLAGALLGMASPSLSVDMTLPSANLAIALPGTEMASVIPGATIEMECCCD